MVDLFVVIIETLKHILINRGPFLVKLRTVSILRRSMVLQIGDLIAFTFEFLDLVNGSELPVEVWNSQLLERWLAWIWETGSCACQIVLVEGIVVHADAPFFARRKLVSLLLSCNRKIFVEGTFG